MSEFQVNLSNCDTEPIHIPGRVQSHGFLIAIDFEHTICFCSENVKDFLNVYAQDLLGKSLSDLEIIIDNVSHQSFLTQLLIMGSSTRGFATNNPYEVIIFTKPYNLIISSDENYILLEFEPLTSYSSVKMPPITERVLSGMLIFNSLTKLLKNAASEVREITGFDRVMVYRFAKDGHGEVVAESKNRKLTSWLGLHFPASDIPLQARELYKRNLTRLIADVYAESSPLIARKGMMDTLDLTCSELRAVSPMHIQYLKNMGVSSSFSISLIHKKELWGLIACHNYTQKSIDYSSRKSAKMIGQILSSGLEFRKKDEDQKLHRSYGKDLEKLANQLMHQETVVQALTENKVNLLNVVKANGAILVLDHQEIRLGITPDERQFKLLRNWITDKSSRSLFRTDALSSVFPPALEYRKFASGMVVLALDREWRDFIVWFKPEKALSIRWAGNPEKSVTENEDGALHISPRLSFKTWKEAIEGRSDQWSAEEINSIRNLRDEITYTLGLKARAMQELNQRLKVAYDELDKFSYTISHDLKNPIAVIRMYAQVLAKDSTSQENRDQISGKIIQVTDKINDMITEVLNYSKVGRHEIRFQPVDVEKMIIGIINDMRLIHYDKVLKITLGNMPVLYGEELMINQVFTNLIGNAIKYSKGGKPAVIYIEGQETGNSICYSIKDHGIGISTHNLLRVFDLFERVDPRNKGIDGSGVGLAIVKRIMSRHHGKIWVESILGEGSTFFFFCTTIQYPNQNCPKTRNYALPIVTVIHNN